MNNREELEQIDEYLETGFLGGLGKKLEESREKDHQLFHQAKWFKGCSYCVNEASQIVNDIQGIYSEKAIEEAKQFLNEEKRK